MSSSKARAPAVPEPLSPLSSEQAQQLAALSHGLSADQALWIGGYFTGLGTALRGGAAAPRPVEAPVQHPAITILYGSQTGHAASLARRTGELAQQRGLRARVLDVAEYRQRELKDEKLLVAMVSTQGDGDPPDSAAPFFEFLAGRKAPKLAGLKYAVLGLGDSSYEHFCKAGRTLDERLAALGGERLHDRIDLDVDYDEGAAQWTEAVLALLERLVEPAPDNVVALATPLPRPAAEAFDRKNPFQAEILDAIVLNGRGSDKETLHIELSLAGSGLVFEPGDSLGIVPRNDPALVVELIETLRLDVDATVAGAAGEVSLREALAADYEVTTLTPPFLKRYAEAAQASALDALLRDDHREALLSYTKSRQIIDLVGEFPVPGLQAGDFVKMLRRLPPRLYSIASSLAANPDEAHLTVSVVRYRSNERDRKGVASAWLVERREVGDAVPVYVEHNKNFKLPADPNAPLIMIGAGTGVAPYRAFLQEREATGASGETWLFFGDRRFRTDFLYQLEWLRFLKDGVLRRMDVAFSRDSVGKVYVQHRMREQARDLYAWLEEGAHFYVCGDATGMAPDVHETLLAIVAEEGGRSREGAADYVRTLQQQRRYQREVY